MTVITTERESLNTTFVQSLGCCPYCGGKEHGEPLDTNHVQSPLSSAPKLIFHTTRTEAQVELVANLSEVLNRALRENLKPLTGEVDHRYLDEVDHRYLDFALEDICNLNTALMTGEVDRQYLDFALEGIRNLNAALVGLHETLVAKQE